MFVEGLMHFQFSYHFVGQEDYPHKCDIYAKDMEAARKQFATNMINAPKCEVLDIEVVESC